jgi:GMP reductase
MKKALHYKDVVLNHPQYSEVYSRDDLDVTVDFCGYEFNNPAIPANMQCSISFEQAENIINNTSAFYILHRFYDYSEILKWVETTDVPVISLSVGVKEKDYEFVENLHKLDKDIDFITIDVAHGHHILVKQMIHFIRDLFGTYVKIIAGNVCTPEACYDLEAWGANAAKIGLSCGAGCCTYNATGVGSPMFSTVLECAKKSPLPIIADGGIREVGDICKALVAGATMVMVGSEFVKCYDSPAENKYEIKNFIRSWEVERKITHKVYFGSASATNKGSDSYVEGHNEVLLPVNGLTYEQYFRKIREGVTSCMSYHNLRDVSKMHTIEWSKHTF